MSTLTLTNAREITSPEQYDAFVSEAIVEQNRVLNSGVVSPLAVPSAGLIHTMPVVKPLTGTPNLATASVATAATAQELSYAEINYFVAEHNAAWKEADYTETESGFATEAYIRGAIAPYWSGVVSNFIGSAMEGVCSNAGLALDVAGSGSYITPERIFEARSGFGDRMTDLNDEVLVIHSDVYTRLLTQDVIAFIPQSETGGTIPTYCGLQVIVDDTVAKKVVGDDALTAAGIVIASGNTNYVSYIVKRGAMKLGFGSAKTPLAVERDELSFNGAGSYTVSSRVRWGMAVNGVSYAQTSAPAAYADLAEAADWTPVFDNALIGMRAIVSDA